MVRMPDFQDLRASDADRETTAERLRAAALEGRLDPIELDERLSSAYSARWCSELSALTLDVTPPPAPPAPAPVYAPRAPVNGLAVASLISGVLWMMWFGSLLAIVFGHVALGQINRSEGREGGRGIAIAGLALGYFGALTFVLTLAAVAAGES
jgi:Domain of unknown function (DUF4190)/Domain of unknown function (DUF1707)